MDPFLVPTAADEPSYTQRTTLDGVVYVFTFRLNQRENTYRFDLALSDGTAIASGVKVVCARDLLENVKWDLRAPPGQLIAQNSGGDADGAPPGVGELGEGRRVQLWYFDAATIAEITAEIASGT